MRTSFFRVLCFVPALLAAGLLLPRAHATEPAKSDANDAADREIRAKIAGIREAILAKSAAGIVQPGTADWLFTGPDGVTFDRAAFIQRTEALFTRVVAITSLDTTVDSIRFADASTAEVEITQTMLRSERAADTGAITQLKLRYREHHTWVRASDGWRVRRVEFIGKPERTVLSVEPAKPQS